MKSQAITDKLFMAWDCSDCATIKQHIQKLMFDDDVCGISGQTLTVVYTFSNNATRNILDIFGLDDHYTPVLLTHNDEIISNADEIIAYIQHNYLNQ